MTPPVAGRTVRVGRDRVTRKGSQVVVVSPVAMTDWVVRQHRRTAIVFEGLRYCILHKDQALRGGVRYVLEPWPERPELPGKTIHYGEDFVRERDGAIRRDRTARGIALLLRPLQFLTGFLFSGTKARIEDHLGLSARRATFYSLCLEFTVWLLHMVVFQILIWTDLFTAAFGRPALRIPYGYLIAVMLILPVDLVVRCGSYLREDPSPYGFAEWVFKRRGMR